LRIDPNVTASAMTPPTLEVYAEHHATRANLAAAAINTESLTASGDVSAVNLSASGDVTVAGLTSTGAISTASLIAESSIETVSLTASGSVSAETITASDDVSALNLVASGEVRTADLTATGAISTASLTAGTSITTAALTATGAFNANSITASGNITTNGTLTVSNLNIRDTCVVYGHGGDANTPMSLLFKKSGTYYAGIVREAGIFRFVENGTGQGGADAVTGIDTGASADITYAACVADKYTCESDQRLKENVVPIDGALEKVGAMRGVYYDWIDKGKGSARQIGVIAQEVQAACPELVDASDAYLTVDYARIAAVLIEAVKDLTARNAALDARVAALEKAA
jgi:hypothetical protein